jgi:hypothetical protein
MYSIFAAQFRTNFDSASYDSKKQTVNLANGK